jgi:hypothetical protein
MDHPALYPDLRAVVHSGHVPGDLHDELPGLYSSLCCTGDWFLTQDGVEANGACCLSDPRHILLFSRRDGTVDVLNKVFPIPPADSERACRAIFRTFPHVHRIHLEIMYPPERLALPYRILYGADHMYVELPTTLDEYKAGIGRRTRSNLQKYEKRVRRDHPDLSTEVLSCDESCQELFDMFVAWKVEWCRQRGMDPLWETHPDRRDKFVQLLRRCGEAQVTTVGDEAVAITFLFMVGDTLYGAHLAFDPSFAAYNMGTLIAYWSIGHGIARGARRFGMMWGAEDYKRHLGAHAVRATRVSVFPTSLSRFWSLDEAREVAGRDIRSRTTDAYWRGRHRAGKVVRSGKREVLRIAGSFDSL